MIRKVCLLLLFASAVSVATGFGQSAVDIADFEDMEGWTVAAGDWSVSENRMHQEDTNALMARVDREVPAEGEYEIRFTVQYEGGGYASEEDLANEILHGGFGVHVGMSDPLLETESWGAGEGYLLWLNLDTREQTAEDHPLHHGLRAQVYESNGPVDMDLLRADWAERVVGNERVSLDVPAAYEEIGGTMEIADLADELSEPYTIRIRVNPESGVVRLDDPTGSGWLAMPLDADKLQEGDYVSLRTNSLAASFGSFGIYEID